MREKERERGGIEKQKGGGREGVGGEREREKEIGLWGPRSPMVCHIPAGEPGKRVVTLLLPSCSIQGHSDLNDAHLHW